MSARGALRISLLAAAFALGTFAFGWVIVPIAAAIWGVIAAERRTAAVEAAAGAGAGWLVLLGAGAARGGGVPMAHAVTEALSLPLGVLVLATILFAIVLAWSAARVARSLALMLTRANRREG